MEYYQRVKLKQRVKNQWWKIPHQPRFNKEESLKSAWQQERSFKKWDSEIDDITWYDLDMFQVFELINATYSSVGSKALYQQLRIIIGNKLRKLRNSSHIIKSFPTCVKKSNMLLRN